MNGVAAGNATAREVDEMDDDVQGGPEEAEQQLEYQPPRDPLCETRHGPSSGYSLGIAA